MNIILLCRSTDLRELLRCVHTCGTSTNQVLKLIKGHENVPSATNMCEEDITYVVRPRVHLIF